MKATIFFALAVLFSTMSQCQEYPEATDHDELWKKQDLPIANHQRIIRIHSGTFMRIVIDKKAKTHRLGAGKIVPADVEQCPTPPKTPNYTVKHSKDCVEIKIPEKKGIHIHEFVSPPGYRIEVQNDGDISLNLDQGFVQAEGGKINLVQEQRAMVWRLADSQNQINKKRHSPNAGYQAFINCKKNPGTHVILNTVEAIHINARAKSKKKSTLAKLLKKLRI